MNARLLDEIRAELDRLNIGHDLKITQYDVDGTISREDVKVYAMFTDCRKSSIESAVNCLNETCAARDMVAKLELPYKLEDRFVIVTSVKEPIDVFKDVRYVIWNSHITSEDKPEDVIEYLIKLFDEMTADEIRILYYFCDFWMTFDKFKDAVDAYNCIKLHVRLDLICTSNAEYHISRFPKLQQRGKICRFIRNVSDYEESLGCFTSVDDVIGLIHREYPEYAIR